MNITLTTLILVTLLTGCDLKNAPIDCSDYAVTKAKVYFECSARPGCTLTGEEYAWAMDIKRISLPCWAGVEK